MNQSPHWAGRLAGRMEDKCASVLEWLSGLVSNHNFAGCYSSGYIKPPDEVHRVACTTGVITGSDAERTDSSAMSYLK